MSAILLSEGIPGKAQRRKAEVAKVAATGNDVSRAMQFEEERFTRLECAKLSIAGRLPKIHFVSLLGAEITEPIVIGHSDEEAHGQDYRRRSTGIELLCSGEQIAGNA